MKKVCSVLLAFALFLSTVSCSQGNYDEGERQAISSTLMGENMGSSSTGASNVIPIDAPRREPDYHDWDGSDTLYPYGVAYYSGQLADEFLFTTGVLIKKGGIISLIDFNHSQIMRYCFRPSCQHDTSQCDALVSNSGNWGFIANKKYYYLDENNARMGENHDLGGQGGEVDLYVSSVMRSDERKVVTIPADTFDIPEADLFLYGDSAYIISSVSDWNPTDTNNSSSNTGYTCVYLTEINLLTDEVVEQKVINQGYYAYAQVESIYGGGIYLFLFHYKEDVDFTFYEGHETEEEHDERINTLSSSAFYRYDIVTGELSQRTDGYPDEYGGPLINDSRVGGGLWPRAVYGDWCVCHDGGIYAYNLATGEEKVICSENASYIINANNCPNAQGNQMLFLLNEEDDFEYLYDFDTGKLEKIPYLKDGENQLRIEKILFSTENVMNASAALLEPGELWGKSIYIRIDLTNGFKANDWELL